MYCRSRSNSIRSWRPIVRRRLFVVGIIAFILVLGITHLVVRNPTELKWMGQPASYWIDRLNYRDMQNGEASAEEFLFAAGPEVIPALIRGLSFEDRWAHDHWVDIYFKLGKWHRYFSMPAKRSSHRANCARGLGLLGPAAAAAVPELLRALDDRDPWVRSSAGEALAQIGVEKAQFVPRLIAGLSSTNANHRLACVIALVHSLPDVEAAPVLHPLLRDPDSNLRSWVAGGLGRDEADPDATAQVLAEALKDSSGTVRNRAAQSLGRLRPRPDV